MNTASSRHDQSFVRLDCCRVDKIAADNPLRAHAKSSNDEVQTADAFAQGSELLFEVDLPETATLKEGRHVAVIVVADGKIQFCKTSTDYKMWAGVQRRFEVLRDAARERLRGASSSKPAMPASPAAPKSEPKKAA